MRSLHHFRQVIVMADRKSLAKIIPLFIKEIEWSTDEIDPTTGHIRVSVYEDFSPEETDSFEWSKPDGACVKSGPKRCEVKLSSIAQYRTFFINPSEKLEDIRMRFPKIAKEVWGISTEK